MKIVCLCEALESAWKAARHPVGIEKLNRVQDYAEEELQAGLWEPFLSMTGHDTRYFPLHEAVN